MDYNTRPHRADIVDDYLECEGIARMAWPAYSPDLYPIENLWNALGRAVSSRFPPPANIIELETDLQEEWRLLNSAVVDHLIESMYCNLELLQQIEALCQYLELQWKLILADSASGLGGTQGPG
ncbi:transposable element Tcb2 transposase [Trichonephila clavipes]|nr:transposable element Tcb2 transposase [Trichonephila clavipes]